MGNSVGWPARATWCLLFLFSTYLWSQDDAALRPVPILTGSTGYFTRVTAGSVQDAPSVSPLLLVPFGDKWLIEAKGSLSDTFAKNRAGTYNGLVSYGATYAQVDYIANPFVTVCAGRFTTPFGIYGERFAPNWIRPLQVTPTTFGLTSGSSLGGMLRGGFPAGTEKVNFDYAVYFSTANTNHIVATDRSTGGRISFFLPGPRLEFGASFQQVLQQDRPHAAGVHFLWQPNRVPLSLRSEYVRTSGLQAAVTGLKPPTNSHRFVISSGLKRWAGDSSSSRRIIFPPLLPASWARWAWIRIRATSGSTTTFAPTSGLRPATDACSRLAGMPTCGRWA